jgi:enterochelin esterase-like enzyme
LVPVLRSELVKLMRVFETKQSVFVWLAILLLTSTACTPAAQQKAPEFSSFDAFVEALERVARDGKRKDVSAFWDSLVDNEQVPFVFGEQVAFLYRGRARSVSWVGDFTEWQNGPSLDGHRVGRSDIWVAYEVFPTNARLEYRIVVNGREGVLDPANPKQQWGGFGPNSVVAMPGYVFPQEINPRDDVPSGDLSAAAEIASTSLGYSISYQVYTPAGYEMLVDLPVIYVTDAHEYTDARMGSMPTVLDNLIADGRIEPVLAVFVDPRDPKTGRNRRESEYLSNPAYAAFLARELVPLIDGTYKTHPAPGGRAILGASYGGVNAAYCGWAYPDVFQLVAMQSPAFVADETIYERYTSADRLPLRMFMSTGHPWDFDARAMKAILEEKNYDLVYMEVPEGHSWGQWRAQLDDLLITFFKSRG